MKTEHNDLIDGDVLAIHDQLSRRIWDMSQIAQQGPDYARGYADGLSEGLIMLDKMAPPHNLNLDNEIGSKLEKIKIDLNNLSVKDPGDRKRIKRVVNRIKSLIRKVMARS